jgi:hypothetical protein
VRVGPIADVSGWLRSVAEVLPLKHREGLPYTLGEAVAELGAYAAAVSEDGWSERSVKKNRASISREIEVQSEFVGPHLRELTAPLLQALRGSVGRSQTVDAAFRFAETWHGGAAISVGFRDVCEAAQTVGIPRRSLRSLAAISASQIGPAAEGPFSQLSTAADYLVSTVSDLNRRREDLLPEMLTEAHRVELAEDMLRRVHAGRVVVWLAYSRATVLNMRMEAGPMTFLRADWALPNVFDDGPNDFPERRELEGIRKEVVWLDDLWEASVKPENRLVIVRVDMGSSPLAGAVDTARRRVEALLSVAVEAGGVSWRSGPYVTILDGRVAGMSLGMNLDIGAPGDDDYGIGATAEIMNNVGTQLGDALADRPMPDSLIEALSALREARMVDHRDVSFYGVRRVTTRVATALEDHAMELIALTIGVRAESLATALQKRETLRVMGQIVASQLTAPFNGSWAEKDYAHLRDIERSFVYNDHGGRVVSIAKAVEIKGEVEAVVMSELERADFNEAVAICTDPTREADLLAEVERFTTLMRARHRRVRNAVNHGLPLEATALDSVRDYAESTSSYAMNLALTWFKAGVSGESLLAREEADLNDRQMRIDSGVSWATFDIENTK